jgi:hypothetical protein
MSRRGPIVTCSCGNCGKPFEVPEYRVRQGRAKYCGLQCAIAKRAEDQRGNQFARSCAKDITGERSGSLVAKEHVGRSRYGIIWSFDCDCGGSIEMTVGEFHRKGKVGRGRDSCYECQPFGTCDRSAAAEKGWAKRTRATPKERARAERKRKAKAVSVQTAAPIPRTASPGGFEFVVDGVVMSRALRADEFTWYKRNFPEGDVREAAA